MAAPSAPNDGRLLALTSPNLRSLESTKDDKSRSLHSYIRSQKVHISTYEREGKSLVASWDLDLSPADIPNATQQEASRKRLRDVDLENGFGTPLLKPRTQAKEPQAPARTHARTSMAGSSSDREDVIDDVGEQGSRRKPSKRAAKERIAARPKRVQGSDDVDSASDKRSPKRLRQADIQDYTRPILAAKPVAASRSKVKRKPSERGRKKLVVESSQKHTVDIEHQDRLAERRERRRAKKAIVAPNPCVAESDSGSVSGSVRSEHHQHRALRSRKTKKGAKSLNIPAGLALMHGFSAQNIGKHRLTLQYDVGVFGKGKASAKATVNKGKTSKPQLKMFSEDRFLRKNKQEGTSHQRVADKDIDHSDDCAAPESSPEPEARPSKRRKRTRVPSSGSATKDLGSSQKNGSQSSCPQKQKEPGKVREPSPNWDIELESGQLGSDSSSGTSICSGEDKTLGGTLLLDTRGFRSRWTTARNDGDTDYHARLDEADETAPVVKDGSSYSPSIAPSNSASQVADRNGQLCSAATARETTSKYFRITKVETGVVNRPLELDALLSSPRQTPSIRSDLPSFHSKHAPSDITANPLTNGSPTNPDSPLSLTRPVTLVQIDPQEVTQLIASPMVSSPLLGQERYPPVVFFTSPPSSIRRPAGPLSPVSPRMASDGSLGTEHMHSGSLNLDPYATYDMAVARYGIADGFLYDTVDAGHLPQYLSDVVPSGDFYPGGAQPPRAESVYLDAEELQEVPPYPEDFRAEWPDREDAEADWENYQATPMMQTEEMEDYYQPLEATEVSNDAPCYDGATDVDALCWATGETTGMCYEDSLTAPYQHYQVNAECESSQAADLDDPTEGWEDESELLTNEPGNYEDPTVLSNSVERFSQGRALLMGVTDSGIDSQGVIGNITAARTRLEADVARALHNGEYWRPQRW
ncbi:hypothetical protein C8Q80DRAFT_1156713 [Daedaleopsis nitida]|nr:hypothetical protein C8Q80DRAFT_1156713 [Daedaleopsis nitida]